MAERGGCSAQEQRGDEPPALAEGVVADGIDPAVDRAQAPADEAAVDLPRRDAAPQELRPRDNPALKARELSDDLVRSARSALSTHTVVKADLAGIRPPQAVSSAPSCASSARLRSGPPP